jgi:hypothetical protein
MTVYACDICDARALDIQRCDECNAWMRAVGVGGVCPGCDEPITAKELLEGGGC